VGLNTRRQVKAIAIDLDGTLVDSLPDLVAAANRMLEDLDLAPMDPQSMRGFVGNGIGVFVRQALQTRYGAGTSDGIFDIAFEKFKFHYSQNLSALSKPYPGVLDGLEKLKEIGYRLACVTNKIHAFTYPLLRDTHLLPYFDLVISGDRVTKKKPDAEPLLHTCHMLQIQPDELLMIGDSANDTVSARAAGCPVFCVPYGYHNGELCDLDHDGIIDSLLDTADRITLKI
jgi:phosphoglycolate phosphatase